MSIPAVVLQWSFSGDLPVPSAGCVNARHRGVACTRCADACPADAVTLGREMPRIDADACLRCDACVPACPTDAIVAGSIESLRAAVADAGSGRAVTIACPRGGREGGTSVVIRHDRCLASLGGEELVVLAARREALWVDDSPCAGCELGPALHARIVAAVERAGGLAEAFGSSQGLRRTSASPSAATPELGAPSSVVVADRAPLSRRGLFRRLIGPTAELLASPDDAGATPTRQRILRHVRTAATPSRVGSDPIDADLGFGRVVVDPERCSACGLCALLCPTGALGLEIGPGVDAPATFTVAARPARCVACDACTAACPEDALRVVAQLDRDAVVDDVTTPVVSGVVVACEVCGAATAAVADGPVRCFGCRPGVVTPLRDERGLMADLLGRTRA